MIARALFREWSTRGLPSSENAEGRTPIVVTMERRAELPMTIQDLLILGGLILEPSERIGIPFNDGIVVVKTLECQRRHERPRAHQVAIRANQPAA